MEKKKKIRCFLDDEDTDQCASTSEKKPKPKVSLESEKWLHFTFMKDISHRKHFVLIGSAYSGTTPEMYIFMYILIHINVLNLQ